jgi:hypothetical protein
MKIRKNNNIIASFIFAGFLIPGIAHSADWRMYTFVGSVTDGDLTRHFIDFDSRREISPNVYEVWLKSDYQMNKNEEAREFLRKMKYDCISRRSKMMAGVKYDPNGNVLDRAEFSDYDSNWNSVVPDTIGEEGLKVTCTGKITWD